MWIRNEDTEVFGRWSDSRNVDLAAVLIASVMFAGLVVMVGFAAVGFP